jgi:hypothetical protein
MATYKPTKYRASIKRADGSLIIGETSEDYTSELYFMDTVNLMLADIPLGGSLVIEKSKQF